MFWIVTSFFLFQIPHRTSNLLEFHEPESMVVHKNGNIYVSDSGNHRIVVLNEDAVKLSEFGRKGQGPGEFNQPGQISIMKDGTLWVGDGSQRRVQHFSEDGQYLGMIKTQYHTGYRVYLTDGRIISTVNSLYQIGGNARDMDYRWLLLDAEGKILRRLGKGSQTKNLVLKINENLGFPVVFDHKIVFVGHVLNRLTFFDAGTLSSFDVPYKLNFVPREPVLKTSGKFVSALSDSLCVGAAPYKEHILMLIASQSTYDESEPVFYLSEVDLEGNPVRVIDKNISGRCLATNFTQTEAYLIIEGEDGWRIRSYSL